MKKALIITAVSVVALAATVCAIATTMNKAQLPISSIKGSGPKPVSIPADAKLVSISFRYSIAMNIEGSYTYTAKDLGEKGYWLEIESPMYKENEVFKTKISEKEYLAAKALVDALDLNQWNEYHKYDTDVLDGSSFYSSFKFQTPDGNKITVNTSGTNCSPEGYWEFRKGIEALFDSYKKQYDYDRIPKKIRSNNLTSLFATFKQQGKSGYSKYDIELKQETWEGGYNINVNYLDYTGEFGPKMLREEEAGAILVKDVKNLDLSPVNAVLKKYNIAAINGYDVSAKDYNNSEWFQISAGYSTPGKDGEKGEYEAINIMGTEKFKNYDAFRHDFLEACLKVARKYNK